MERKEKKWWVLLGVGISSMIVAIDFTIVNTVLAQIQASFAVPMSDLQWIMTGFGITFSAFLITMGKLGDLLGRRFLLYIGMAGFGLASLGAGISGTIYQLITFRVFQGIFGAIIFPCGMAITSNAFPEEERGRALGIYGSFLGIGLAIGPVLGGIITTITTWRWIFLINVPVIILSFVICFSVVKESRLSGKQNIDWVGMLLITLGLASFVFSVTQSETFGWDEPIIFIPFIVAILLFSILFYLERYAREPLLPPQLFLNREFLIGTTVYSTCVGLMWVVIFFVPLYLQTVFHLSEMQTGLTLLPMTIMTVIAPTVSGYLFDKQGPFATVMFAFAMIFIGFILFLFFTETFSWPLIIISFICIGLTWGIGNGISMPLALSSPENKEHEGVVSGAAITVLNIIGVMSLSIASVISHHYQNEELSAGSSAADAFMVSFHAVTVFLLCMALGAFFAIFYLFKTRKKRRLQS